MSNPKFKSIYTQTAIILFNTLLLFVLLNLVANYLLINQNKANLKAPKVIPKNLISSPSDYVNNLDNPSNLLFKVYPGHNAEGIRQILFNKPGMVDHPILDLASAPGHYGEYNIGKEGIRFDDYITPKNIDSLINGSIWLFGGSTMFGFCAAQSETIGNYLNQLDSDKRYINFGTPGYNSSMEINKLILLLKKGYRPQKVIFLDGSNDLLSYSKSNFHPSESPARLSLAYPMSTKNRPEEKRKLIALDKLPMLQLLRSPSSEDTKNVLNLPYTNLADSSSIYYVDKNSHQKANRWLSCEDLEFFPDKISELYRMNADQIHHLAKGYEFDYQILFQPIGYFHPNNPFIKNFESFRKEFECFDLLLETQQTIRDQIASKALSNFHDLSQAHNSCSDCYVDLVHYSSILNKHLAENILAFQN